MSGVFCCRMASLFFAFSSEHGVKNEHLLGMQVFRLTRSLVVDVLA